MERKLLTKRPFTRVLPAMEMPRIIRSHEPIEISNCESAYWNISQAQFLREYDPSGHDINSNKCYPDRIKYNEEKKEYYKEYLFRASFPFQRIIHAQQLVHICGNDIHNELSEVHVNKSETDLMLLLNKGVLLRDLDVSFYQRASAVKKTGDGATVFYFNRNGEVRWKTLSFDRGDTLFPHYNDDTGELELFARMYNAYDANGECVNTYVEVWDETYMTRFRKDCLGNGDIIHIGDYLLDGYVIDQKPTPHGFKEVPVVYDRDNNGACWSGSQDSIDKYELAVSHLCQNNMAYAFPIMVLKGNEIDIKADIYGAVKAIDAGTDGTAEYLEPHGNAESFRLQLEILLKNIFQGSFSVLPPEIKSGDLPGVAIKLIYSPSVDKAIIDAKNFQLSIMKSMRLFKWGYGIETGKARELSNLHTYSWIDPYVHQNQSELVNNLVQLVNSGLLSANTGSTLHGYGENNEFDKIMYEYKKQQEADLLNDLRQQGDDTTATGTTSTSKAD